MYIIIEYVSYDTQYIAHKLLYNVHKLSFII